MSETIFFPLNSLLSPGGHLLQADYNSDDLFKGMGPVMVLRKTCPCLKVISILRPFELYTLRFFSVLSGIVLDCPADSLSASFCSSMFFLVF